MEKFGVDYEVVDVKEYITLADSFVKNKTGSGHGEAKLYVGNESEELNTFFQDFSFECFVYKSDLLKYLNDAKDEFINPQQNYVDKIGIFNRYLENKKTIEEYKQNYYKLNLRRIDVNPPRVYIKSDDLIFDIIRNIGLPNISYLSFIKLKRKIDGQISLYLRIFIDYGLEDNSFADKNESTSIEENSSLSENEKKTLIKARIGQGQFREKLLSECPYCPITMLNDERILIASHIKPWVVSNDKEKIDPKNGLMLSPTYDRLFDRGFISFNDDKTMLVSPWLSPMNQKRLQIYNGKIIKDVNLDNQRKIYMKYHRENIFNK